jgi:hypothetical protein
MELKSFGEVIGKDVRLGADLRLHAGAIELQFQLQDPHKMIQDIPADFQKISWVRENDLWKSTCFEAFWARKGEKSYWELNLSLLGKWNLYFFSDYRSLLKSSADFQLQAVSWNDGILSVQLKNYVSLENIEANLCSVLKDREDKIHHMSACHRPEKADFHWREAFILERGLK